jgi:RIO-like serine/threonine protein kinase
MTKMTNMTKMTKITKITKMTETFIKNNVSAQEHMMQKFVYDLKIVNVPKIISYNKKTKTMVMEKIANCNISDFYGEDIDLISDELYENIRIIVKTLYENGIEYIDVTGYNFIEDDDGNIWVIDFEHATFIKKQKKQKNKFVQDFINGTKKWNNEFL